MKEIKIDNRTKKEKFDSFMYEVKDKSKVVFEWIGDHKYEIIIGGVIVGSWVTKIVVSANATKRSDNEITKRKCDKYDPRTGEHYFTNKPLTNNQQLELERRYNNGESKGEILHDMGLL